MDIRKTFQTSLLAALAGWTCSAVTVTPKATDEALVNPDMGLCFYAYAGRLWAYGAKTPNYDTLDWFPGCSTVYMRLLWADVEPTEGDFRWDLFDRLAQPWIAKGKKIAIRVICCNQTENATPDWVRDAGAKGHWFEYATFKKLGVKDPPLRWEPDYADPVFLEKFDRFLDAFAARYDGDPSVAFVDIGSFGVYGEGHSPYLAELREKNPQEFDRQAALHLELWRKRLPKSFLVVSDDIGGAWNMAPDHPLMQRARELGIGFRDDSIFCAPPPNSWKHAHWAKAFAPLSPIVVEIGHASILEQRGIFVRERLLECVEEYRASYLSIHDFPERYLATYRAEIDAVNRRLGYRFVLRSATFPNEVIPDEPVVIESTWVNSGVAAYLRGATLCWSLLDAQGNVCWSATDNAFDFKRLEPTLGGKEHPLVVRSRVRFGHTVKNPDPDNCLIWARDTGRDPGAVNVMLPSGVYTLCVSVGTRQGTPEIALPLAGAKGRRYPLGLVTVR